MPSKVASSTSRDGQVGDRLDLVVVEHRAVEDADLDLRLLELLLEVLDDLGGGADVARRR